MRWARAAGALLGVALLAAAAAAQGAECVPEEARIDSSADFEDSNWRAAPFVLLLIGIPVLLLGAAFLARDVGRPGRSGTLAALAGYAGAPGVALLVFLGTHCSGMGPGAWFLFGGPHLAIAGIFVLCVVDLLRSSRESREEMAAGARARLAAMAGTGPHRRGPARDPGPSPG